jgi:carbon storage regulator CsrA
VFGRAGFFLVLAAGLDRNKNGGSSMLVLTRKTQESVVVGGSNGFEQLLKVTVVQISGEKVRLGFEVDKEVPVHRAEVWERIRIHGRRTVPPK